MMALTVQPITTTFTASANTSCFDDFLNTPTTYESMCDIMHPNCTFHSHPQLPFSEPPPGTFSFADCIPMHPLDIHYNPSLAHPNLNGTGELKLEDLFSLIDDSSSTANGDEIGCGSSSVASGSPYASSVVMDHGLPSPARSLHDTLDALDVADFKLGCDGLLDGVQTGSACSEASSSDEMGKEGAVASELDPPSAESLFDGDLSTFVAGLTDGDNVSALFGHEIAPPSPTSAVPSEVPTILVKLEEHRGPYSPPSSPIKPLNTPPPIYPLQTNFLNQDPSNHASLPSPSSSTSSSPIFPTYHRRNPSTTSTTSTTSLPPIQPIRITLRKPTPTTATTRTTKSVTTKPSKRATQATTAKSTHHRTSYPAIYKCEFPGCAKVFTRSYNLKSHRKIHTGDELFLCPYCPSRFTRGHDLKRHVRLHTNERPFRCPNCDRSFSRSDALKRHVKVDACHGKVEQEEELDVVKEDVEEEVDLKVECGGEDEVEMEGDV